ncbi:2-aminoadipate aminotransferase [Spiribacter halobius]|uniref:2-aminoadipate aminotransferase n=2 Tax=Sediminicurvatus halobius TaxID=2182432 RepID=A0A2U2N6G9_9GAMM|nr:2-aminoadipate aminotransferase [Spiribacter halobius]
MPTRSDGAMWSRLFELDTQCGISLQQQIRETLVGAILDGHIPVDVPLPSSRELARQLGVARNTVMLAYQHLVDEGYLLARERSGFYVNPEMHRRNLAPGEPDAAAAAVEGCVRWDARLMARPSAQRNIVKPIDWERYEYPFIYGQMDPAMFPLNDWRECYRQALSVQGVRDLVRDRLDADDPLLVEQIRTRVLPKRGVWAAPEEILVTLGTQNALYLLAGLLVSRHTRVGIEDPGYPDARNILQMMSDAVVPLPLDEQGLVIGEHLDACDYVFVTPSHQSPTTVTLPAGRRKALLERAAQAGFVIIEDDYESEINFLGSPTPALKSYDRQGRVLYVGSLSKTLDPGLRIGYLVGPPDLIREARALRRLMLRHPPTNNQHAAAQFLALGHHDALTQRLGNVYRERWQAMGEALNEHLPDTFRMPTFGGTSYWIRGPSALDARRLAARAAEAGIFFEPGDVNFLSERPPQHCFRLGFSSIPVERIEPGIRRLAGLIAEQLGGY